MQLAGPLLFKLYDAMRARVRELLAQQEAVTLTMDGWSRTQGAEHLVGMCAAFYGAAVFLDVKAARADKVDAVKLRVSLMSCLHHARLGFDLSKRSMGFVSVPFTDHLVPSISEFHFDLSQWIFLSGVEFILWSQ